MLQPWISHCTVGDRVVFLDSRRNRYSTLSAQAGIALVDGNLARIPPAVLKRALNDRWLGPDCATATIEHVRPPVSAVEFGTIGVRARKTAVIRAVGSLIAVRASLSIRPLHRVLQNVTTRNGQARRKQNRGSVPDILLAFQWSERFLLNSKSCLLRSLAQHAILASNGHASSLVFGVKLHPFEAHCWLQQEDIVINDTIERVGMFIPIKAVL